MTKELLPGLLAVEGSKNTKGLVLVKSTYYAPSFLYFKEEGRIEDLPPGTWSILGLGTADKITEDEWAEVVEWKNETDFIDDIKPLEYTIYMDYEHDEYSADDPTASGLSLLASHNLNPSTTVLLTNKK